jgi:Membrane protein TerC, possibly involved in tellurium resistance
MQPDTISYLIFIVALLISFVLDLFVFSKPNQKLSIKQASFQYIFWVSIAMVYGIYLWYHFGTEIGVNYYAAYFMEMSLSVDNIFVFVMIFSSVQVRKQYVGRVLMIGVVLAILFRIIFIAIGIALIQQFHWILYIFGALLVLQDSKCFLKIKKKNTTCAMVRYISLCENTYDIPRRKQKENSV